jgi:hypothetical protein
MNDDKEKGLCGNTSLVGFEVLDETEQLTIEKIVGNYVKKICERGELKEIKITLLQHPHGKSNINEIQGIAFVDNKRFASNATDRNLFAAVSKVCENIHAEIGHKQKC